MTFGALQGALSEAITGTQCWTHSHIRIPFNPEHSGKKTEKVGDVGMKQMKQQKLLKYSLEGEPVGQVPRDSAAARTALLVQCSCCTTAILTTSCTFRTQSPIFGSIATKPGV